RTQPANWPYVFRFYRAALSGQAAAVPMRPGEPPQPLAAPWGFPPSLAAGPPSGGLSNGIVPNNAAPNVSALGLGAPNIGVPNVGMANARAANSATHVTTSPGAENPPGAMPPADSRLAMSQPKPSSRPRRGALVAQERAGSTDDRDLRAAAPHWWP